MNFDGQALVVNYIDATFYSENGSAMVYPTFNQTFNYCFNDSNVDRHDSVDNHQHFIGDANILIRNEYFDKSISVKSSLQTARMVKCGEVPFTTQVRAKGDTGWKDICFPAITVHIADERIKYNRECISEARVTIHDTTSRYTRENYNFIDDYKFASAIVHDIAIPTNLYILNDTTAYIVECIKKESSKEFASVSANIIDKTEIVVPSPFKGYQDMFLVVQKNNFIELKLSDTIVSVTGLPEGLEYSLNTIKGVVLKSGSYDIRIQYQESSQKLNIIVPYYERTL